MESEEGERVNGRQNPEEEHCSSEAVDMAGQPRLKSANSLMATVRHRMKVCIVFRRVYLFHVNLFFELKIKHEIPTKSS